MLWTLVLREFASLEELPHEPLHVDVGELTRTLIGALPLEQVWGS